jgi:hypothetical protein
MSGATDLLEERILDWAFVLGAPVQPSNLHAALFTVLPADDGTGGTEVSGGSYARQPVTLVRTAQTVNPNAVVQFPTATADWGLVIGFGIFDALAAGNLLYFDSLDANQSILDTDDALFQTADLAISLD